MTKEQQVNKSDNKPELTSPDFTKLNYDEGSGIDARTLVKDTFTIPDGMMPKGNWWDKDGACFKAVPCVVTRWRWAAMNAKALKTGYTGQELFPFVMPKGKSDE